LHWRYSELNIAMIGMRFEADSSIQQTVTRELKAIREERFLGHLIHCMSDINIVWMQARTILNDKYFYFLCVFCGLSLGTQLSHYVRCAKILANL
jgi:hypothetical protein